jgi:hypothetical protein
MGGRAECSGLGIINPGEGSAAFCLSELLRGIDCPFTASSKPRSYLEGSESGKRRIEVSELGMSAFLSGSVLDSFGGAKLELNWGRYSKIMLPEWKD